MAAEIDTVAAGTETKSLTQSEDSAATTATTAPAAMIVSSAATPVREWGAHPCLLATKRTGVSPYQSQRPLLSLPPLWKEAAAAAAVAVAVAAVATRLHLPFQLKPPTATRPQETRGDRGPNQTRS